MISLNSEVGDLNALIHEIGPEFAKRAGQHDEDDIFVEENYAVLKEHRIFSALVPKELGGGGFSHGEMCHMLHALAGYCASTALAVSMHQHLVAATVWKYRNKGEGRELLEKVAANELVLISTGARDWLCSNGSAERVDGGYLVFAKKAFASGCMAGDMLVTSVPYEDSNDGPKVLHFGVSMDQAGVEIGTDWEVMGMRGTGSHTVTLDNILIPDEQITLSRDGGEYHPFWNVVLTVAMPLVTSVYVGISDCAAATAVSIVKRRELDPIGIQLLGELENERAQAQMAMESMIALANEYDFEPIDERASDVLVRKTLGMLAARRCVAKAMEIAGAACYRRGHILERLFRDVQAGEYHPLGQKQQMDFTGRVALGLEPQK